MTKLLKECIELRKTMNSPASKVKHAQYRGGRRTFRPISVEMLRSQTIYCATRVNNNGIGIYNKTYYYDLLDNKPGNEYGAHDPITGEQSITLTALKPEFCVYEDHVTFSKTDTFNPFSSLGSWTFNTLISLFNTKEKLTNKFDFAVKFYRMRFVTNAETNEKGVQYQSWRRSNKYEDIDVIIKAPAVYTYRTEVPGQSKAMIAKIPMYQGMKFNFDGVPMNLDCKKAKESQEAFDTYMEHYRTRQQILRKANKDDKEATFAIHKARSENNFERIRPEDAFKVRNVSERRLYLEKFPVEEIIKHMTDVDVCDTSTVNDSEYSLVKFPHPDPNNRFTHCYYLKMLNPSTGETHLEGVGPFGEWDGIRAETVEAALAWRDGDGRVSSEDGRIDQSRNSEYEAPLAIS